MPKRKALTPQERESLAPNDHFKKHGPQGLCDQLMDTHEMMRLMHLQITRGDIDSAQDTFNELAKKRSAARYADIHVRDTGVSAWNSNLLAKAGIYTVKDLANQCASKMITHFSALDCLEFTLQALRKIVELETQRS